MAKPTIPVSYRFGENRIEPMPYFLYEVSIYKVTKNMAGLLDSKYYKSDKLLKIKDEVTCKKFKDYQIIRYIDLLGAPMEFIKENKLPIYELRKPSKKKKK